MSFNVTNKLEDPATRQECIQRFSITSEANRKVLVPAYSSGMTAEQWTDLFLGTMRDISAIPAMQRFQRKINKALEGKEPDYDAKVRAGMKAIQQTTCAKCGDYAAQKCARCFAVYYCTQDCQRADWSRHKITCQPRTK